MDLDLCCVASFLALLEEGHYGRAAHRLNVTTPALTKRIQRLERQVGAPLVVERGGAGVTGATGADFGSGRRRRSSWLGPRRCRGAGGWAETPRPTVRLGVPGQVGDTPAQSSPPRAVAAGSPLPPRRGPGRPCPVPYSDIGAALLTGDVDVMWGLTACVHPSLEELTLVSNSRRAAMVSDEHPLAGASGSPWPTSSTCQSRTTRLCPLDWMTRCSWETFDRRAMRTWYRSTRWTARACSGRPPGRRSRSCPSASCQHCWPTLRVVPVTDLPSGRTTQPGGGATGAARSAP